MNISVKASTKLDYKASKEEFELLSGNAAGVCYMPVDFEKLNNEDKSKTIGRVARTIGGGHHSVCGHAFVTLQIENAPKLFAMLLNNEKVYNTSEKSARYTHMALNGIEKELYDKWCKILFDLISKKYGNVKYFDEKRITKLSMEIARYFTSIMTPTSFEYTVDYRQLNYICGWLKKLENSENDLYKMLVPTANEFLNKINDLDYLNNDLMDDRKDRSFSLIGKRVRNEEFGENYSINYDASFAYLAQAQRHRTLSYELLVPEKFSCYIPDIIKGKDELVQEWIGDMNKVADLRPQGELLLINERGAYENLILKSRERLCTAAQHEIMKVTNKIMNKYVANTTSQIARDEMLMYANKARCMTGYPCKEPCGFMEGTDLTRKI